MPSTCIAHGLAAMATGIAPLAPLTFPLLAACGGATEGAVHSAGVPRELRRLADRLHARNLRLLRRHGVPLALGSDAYEGTSLGEAMYLRGLGVVDNGALLEIWSMTTPRAIFPDRRVGCLEERCEASFLVLGGDPIADFAHVRDIELRVKEGRVIRLPAEP